MGMKCGSARKAFFEDEYVGSWLQQHDQKWAIYAADITCTVRSEVEGMPLFNDT